MPDLAAPRSRPAAPRASRPAPRPATRPTAPAPAASARPARPAAVLPPATLPPDVRKAVAAPGPGQPLTPEVAGPLSGRLGVDLGAVRVHTDAPARAAVAVLGARAFTWGASIFLGAGERPTDLGLMGHEVAHTLQQAPGPAVRLFGGPHGDLEAEAHAVSAAVVRGEPTAVRGRTGGARVQGLFDWARRGLSAIGGAVASVASSVANLGRAALDKVAEFVRERAASIPGYGMLGFVLGRDPVTQQPVERTATNLIRALVTLIPGGAKVLADLESARVIQRAADWLGVELPKLGLTWAYVRGLFAAAWDALSVTDLLSPSRAWDKLKGVFGPALGRLKDFALAAGKKLLEFVFEGALALGGSAAQQVLAIFRRIGAVFGIIAADPVRFLGNLLTAVKGGFSAFAKNILAHLRTALFAWLLGALGGVLRLPSRFDFAGILSIILQVLGLTYGVLRGILVKIIGEPAVAYVEKIFEFLALVLDKGIEAAWEKIKEFASGLADAVIAGIRDWVAKSVVGAAITKLVTLFNPVGAIIQSVIAIYNTVMFFKERAEQIARVVNSVIDSVEAIARGSTAAAAQFVERTMGQTLPVIIAFLARLVGLGNVAEHVKTVIKKIQTTISGAMERVARWIADRVKGLLAGRKGKKDDPAATPKTKSEQVRKRAYDEMQKEAAKKLTAPQMAQAVRAVAARLRPEGLQRLETGAADTAGVVTVSAAASDFLPLAQIAPPGAVPDRKVTLFAELRLTEAVTVTPGPIEATDVHGQVPRGALALGVRSRGAGIVLDQPAPTIVRTVTWNTANLNAPDNVSHAEHHFLSWLIGQKDLLPRIRSIDINLKDLSPCATCTGDLIRALRAVVVARKQPFVGTGEAVLTWTETYLGRSGGINATTATGVQELIDAGWKLHAPRVAQGDPLDRTRVIVVPPTRRPQP